MDFHIWPTYFVAAWVIALSPRSGAVLHMSHGLASQLKNPLKTAKARVVQNRIFGGVLIVMGSSLLFARRATL
jgi:threonine/homoserine/homoserine lactone efflux protein